MKLDRFLMFFQKYVLSKSYILMELEFALLDTLDLHRPSPEFKKYESLKEIEEACAKVEAFEKNHFQDGRVTEEFTSEIDGAQEKRSRTITKSVSVLTDDSYAALDNLIDSFSYEDLEKKPLQQQQQKCKRGEDWKSKKTKKPSQEEAKDTPEQAAERAKKEIEDMMMQMNNLMDMPEDPTPPHPAQPLKMPIPAPTAPP
eukprot:CAMPEP_0170508506 /NCGR_PEP_ID=MMETSP0208-20121228/62547_1 /TAXON_ID=197538 /ORGANISM="Strombidium inclinatum, Strain S3" /LENGTH=199 /DNA_ID=CAMNT_0010791443 /DNA_START=2519 /DNA_END=3118 /DNA_ORIENTATION=+